MRPRGTLDPCQYCRTYGRCQHNPRPRWLDAESHGAAAMAIAVAVGFVAAFWVLVR